jgi:hypothetical protein
MVCSVGADVLSCGGWFAGLMTTMGGVGHTLPFLITNFHVAMLVAVVVVALELAAISWIRHKYMDTPLLAAAFQVVVGGAGLSDRHPDRISLAAFGLRMNEAEVGSMRNRRKHGPAVSKRLLELRFAEKNTDFGSVFGRSADFSRMSGALALFCTMWR